MGRVFTNESRPNEKERKVWNEYQGAYKDIKNILDKISAIAKVDDFKSELDSINIKAESARDSLFKTVDILEVKSCIKSLEDLKKRMEAKYADFYHMYLLQENIKIKLNEKEQGILDVIRSTNELLELMNKCSTTNKDKDLEKVYDDCSGTIYKALIGEQIYDKTDIVRTLTKDPKYNAIKEGLVKYFAEDLNALGNNNVINEELSNINSGLGYDFINEKVIDQIVEAKFQKEKDEFYERKEEILRDLKSRVFAYQADAKSLKRDLKESRSDLRGYRVTRVFNTAKILSFVIVPVLAISGGYHLGVHLSNKIDEYRTTTRVVDPVTNEVVDVLSDGYDEKENTYTSTLKIYEPWKKNAKGTGYIRKVTAYVTDPSVSMENLDANNLTEKYHYTEAKEQLDEKDSTDESVTLLTETIQDKNDSRKSRKYVVWLSIAGGVLGVLIDLLLAYGMEPDEVMREISGLGNDIADEKRSKRRLKEKRKVLKGNITTFGKEIETDNNIYQFSKDDFSSLKVIKKTL